jgi:hypothetical protein
MMKRDSEYGLKQMEKGHMQRKGQCMGSRL